MAGIAVVCGDFLPKTNAKKIAVTSTAETHTAYVFIWLENIAVQQSKNPTDGNQDDLREVMSRGELERPKNYPFTNKVAAQATERGSAIRPTLIF